MAQMGADPKGGSHRAHRSSYPQSMSPRSGTGRRLKMTGARHPFGVGIGIVSDDRSFGGGRVDTDTDSDPEVRRLNRGNGRGTWNPIKMTGV
jgi:hypothetical protein